MDAPLMRPAHRLAAARLQRREDWLTALTLLMVVALGVAVMVWVPVA